MSLLGVASDLARRMPPSRTKSRAGRILAATAARVGASPDVTVTLRDGTRIILDARSRTESSAVWDGEYEPGMVDVLSFCVDKHGWVADVGANVGLITLPLARRIAHRGGGVVAFEPIERNAARLRASAALNEVRVEMHVLALGEEDDDVTIWLDRQLGAATGNARIGQRQRPDEEPVTCAVRRLDDLRIRPVDALKVDVEGTEVAFLRGAQRYLATHRPVILGEFNSELMPLQNTDFTDVPPLLPDGYRIAAFVAQGVVEVAAKKGLGDVLLVPEERWPAVIERVNSASDVAFGQEGPGTD